MLEILKVFSQNGAEWNQNDRTRIHPIISWGPACPLRSAVLRSDGPLLLQLKGVITPTPHPFSCLSLSWWVTQSLVSSHSWWSLATKIYPNTFVDMTSCPSHSTLLLISFPGTYMSLEPLWFWLIFAHYPGLEAYQASRNLSPEDLGKERVQTFIL